MASLDLLLKIRGPILAKNGPGVVWMNYISNCGLLPELMQICRGKNKYSDKDGKISDFHRDFACIEPQNTSSEANWIPRATTSAKN